MTRIYYKLSFILIILMLVLIGNNLQADINDPVYHTVEEIYARMFALQDSLPDRVRVDSIGHSQQDRIPIYALKISENVNDDISERPAVLFHDLHAEEVLGIEYCMWLIEKLIKHSDQYSRSWFEEVDIWFIPTSNPEGLTAVYEYDPSYRKNKRNTLQDGRFRYHPGEGNDTSGVDLNRNFPLFWIHGDGFLAEGDKEPNDYYRGHGPLSESESQALDRFVDKYRPLFAVTFHSSRTGKLSQRIYYPWGRGWGERNNPKFSPDIHTISELCVKMAARTRKFGESGPYLAAPIASYNGDCDTYFYWKYGSISMRMEIGAGGPGGMQPDSTGIMEVIDGCHPGIGYLLNCASGIESPDANEKGPSIRTRIDMRTFTGGDPGEPIEAVIDLKSITSPIMPFRTTNPRTGMYHWPVLGGFDDTLTVRKFGYYTRRARVTASVGFVRKLEMFPLPAASVTFRIITNDSSIIKDEVDLVIQHFSTPGLVGLGSNLDSTDIEVPLNYPGNEFVYPVKNGLINLDLPEGSYSATFICGDKYVPRRLEIDVDSTLDMDVILSEAVTLLSQDFDSGDIIYTTDNNVNPYGSGADSLSRWEITGSMSHSPPRCLTDSRYMSTIKNEDSWCAPYNLLDGHFNLETAGAAALVYWLNQALEPGYDSMWVEVSIGGDPGSNPHDWTWTSIAQAHQDISILENVPERSWNASPINLQQFTPWKRFVIPLDDYCSESIFHFRFHIRSDDFIQEDGVYIDNVMLLASDVAPPEAASVDQQPAEFVLDDPYPNPFNGWLTVKFSISNDGWVKLELFDLSGRIALECEQTAYSQGLHTASVDAARLPSGLYILRVTSSFGFGLKKVMLIR